MQHEPWISRRSIHPAATKAPGSGSTKEAPRETNVARVGCLCAKAPSLATAARKETLRPKQPARVVDCYKEITLTSSCCLLPVIPKIFRVACFKTFKIHPPIHRAWPVGRKEQCRAGHILMKGGFTSLLRTCVHVLPFLSN